MSYSHFKIPKIEHVHEIKHSAHITYSNACTIVDIYVMALCTWGMLLVFTVTRKWWSGMCSKTFGYSVQTPTSLYHIYAQYRKYK